MARARRKTALDEEIKRLYAGPLGEFTAARQALAKRLDKEGQDEAAGEVKSLAKPSLSAWAVNQLFAREPRRIEELLAAGERARAGQRQAVSGRGGDVLRESLEAERQLRDDLRRRAAEILEESTGRKASAAMLERVATSLDALALSPDAAEAAERGWISQDLDPPGFEVLAGLQLATAPRPRHLRLVSPPAREEKAPPRGRPAARTAKARGRAEPEPDLQALKAQAARRREEEAERRRREREEEKLRERIARFEEKVAAAQAEADTYRREAERAEKAAEDAEREVAAARRRAETARDDARRARERAERADERLDRARKDLQSVRRFTQG